jgi:hypothetical protein
MIAAWPLDAKFFHELLRIDEVEVLRAQRIGCPSCGGRLDRADFPRKVRGIPEPWEGVFARRLSLCCAREGCRKRVTPGSVRFLGRRVYAAVVVLLASLVCGIVGGPQVAQRTRRRWAVFWRETVPATDFFRVTRARFMPPLDEALLPSSLVERFRAQVPADVAQALVKTLSFLGPITGSACLLRLDL